MSNYPIFIYDDEYTGPRFVYGLQNRPPSVGAVPRGFIIGSHRPAEGFRHGTLDYTVRMTEEEAAGYELDFVGEKGAGNRWTSS
jgi:hypothetical protein